MPICAPDTHTRKVWEVSGLVTNFPCRRQYSDTDITVSFGARFLLLSSASLQPCREADPSIGYWLAVFAPP